MLHLEFGWLLVDLEVDHVFGNVSTIVNWVPCGCHVNECSPSTEASNLVCSFLVQTQSLTTKVSTALSNELHSRAAMFLTKKGHRKWPYFPRSRLHIVASSFRSSGDRFPSPLAQASPLGSRLFLRTMPRPYSPDA